MERVELRVPDMSCAHCEAAIRKALGALPGVAAVEVDLAAKRVRVEFDPARVSPEAIEKSVAEAGYTVAR
ncbi:MAG: heavy-metal-associated domain-containing protein [Firmicutes bacterium]|nr:heavy-metal-associated domain-containing protein [Bacillota bacterium]